MHVSVRLQTCGDFQLNCSFGLVGPEFPCHLRSKCTEVDRPARHLSPRNPGKNQKVINQSPHSLRRRTNALKIVLPGCVKRLGIVFEQRLAESVDTPQGGSEVM